MGFLSQIANVFTGGEDAKASKKAGQIQRQEAVAQGANLNQAGQTAMGLFDPLANVGARGIDLAGFLGDPQQQADSLQNNPLFQMGLTNLNENTNQTAAARRRLSSGDTLQQLTQNAMLVGQPLIDRQRQDIMGMLGIGQNAIGQQATIGQNTASNVANMLTGGAAAQAAGVVGAQNARSGAMGNTVDLAMMAMGAPSGTFSNPFASATSAASSAPGTGNNPADYASFIG